MKLNYDCMRDVLLFLEKNIVLDDDLYFPETFSIDVILEDASIAEKYTKAEVYYAIHNMDQCGFLYVQKNESDDKVEYFVYDITYDGHVFLSGIRSDTVWKNIKDKLISMGISNIPTILTCVEKYVEGFFKK